MERRFVSRLLGWTLAACLLGGGPRLGLATVVFDDHFTGNSGGMPAGWSQVFGAGSAVESGTTVTLHGAVIMVSAATVDPSTGTLTLTADVAGTSAAVAPLGLGLLDLDATHLLLVQLHLSDLRLEVAVSSNGGDSWQVYEATHLTGYAYGALKLTLVLKATAFSITSDAPAFSSGLIDYATVFPGFSRDDLGTACHLAIAQSTDDPGAASSSVDRVAVDIGAAVSAEGMTFGRVKTLYR